MSDLLALDSDVLDCIQEVLDCLIAPPYSKTCRLVYPSRAVDCVNCKYDPIGQRSANVYTHGGPIPFNNGTTCPMCEGAGKRHDQVTEDIQMLCSFNVQDFFRPMPGIDVRTPSGMIQTKGFMRDLPKVQQADHIIFQVAIEGIARRKYKLASEPGDDLNIIQGRYFVATWERM